MPATSAGMTVVNRCVHSPKLHLPRTRAICASGHSSIAALVSFQKRGGRSAARRIGPSVGLPPREAALRSAPARRFLGPGRAFREAAQAQTSPSASSSRRLVVAGGGAPRPSRVRGCEPRPRAPLPIPRQARLQDAPLVDRDARIVTPPEEPGISFAKNFRIEIV